MKIHPATQFKRAHPPININPDISTSQPIGVIGRRTGHLFIDENEEDGKDFFFKDNDFKMKQFARQKDFFQQEYQSNSSNSDSSNYQKDSSSSEAEESSIEQSSDNSSDDDKEDSEGTIIPSKKDKIKKDMTINKSKINYPTKEIKVEAIKKNDTINSNKQEENIKKEENEQNSAGNTSFLKFKTKEQIQKIMSTQNNNKQKAKDVSKIEGLSTIKKIEKGNNDVSIAEEENLLNELNINKRLSNLGKKSSLAESIDLNEPSIDFDNVPEVNGGSINLNGLSNIKLDNKTIPEIPDEENDEGKDVTSKEQKEQSLNKKGKVKEAKSQSKSEKEINKDKKKKKYSWKDKKDKKEKINHKNKIEKDEEDDSNNDNSNNTISEKDSDIDKNENKKRKTKSNKNKKNEESDNKEDNAIIDKEEKTNIEKEKENIQSSIRMSKVKEQSNQLDESRKNNKKVKKTKKINQNRQNDESVDDKSDIKEDIEKKEKKEQKEKNKDKNTIKDKSKLSISLKAEKKNSNSSLIQNNSIPQINISSSKSKKIIIDDDNEIEKPFENNESMLDANSFNSPDNSIEKKEKESQKEIEKARNKKKVSKDYSLDDKPVKRKAKDVTKSKDPPKTNTRKIHKKAPAFKELAEALDFQKFLDKHQGEIRTICFDTVNSKQKFFGVNNRYSLRNRVRKLNPILGERIQYVRTQYGDEIRTVYSSKLALQQLREKYEKDKKLKKKLVKAKKTDLSSDLSENYSERDDENNNKLLIVKPKSMKNDAKNYQTELEFKIIESANQNEIIVNDKSYKNVKKSTIINITPFAIYSIKNYSKENLVIQVCFPDEEDDD